MTFETFEPELHRLVASFTRQFADLTGPGYAEAQLRDDFLNPLFRALGWDLENKAGHIQNDREVEIESRTDIAGKAKRADYLFRTDGTNRFVCEAKKPRETLGPKHAFQAKRYAWNKALPLAVLSDFEEIKIYVVGGKPHLDRPDEGLWKRWHFSEFPAVAREIWDLLSRPAVAAGSIDALLDSLPKRPSTGRGKARQLYLIKPDRTRALDTEFLAFLDEARRSLGSDLVKHNPEGDIRDVARLTEAVQHILDRLLFLRICEDRDIDTGTRLDSIVQTWQRNYGREDTKRYRQTVLLEGDASGETSAGRTEDAPPESLWYAIVRHFRALDRRPASHVPFFNGQLFKHHFTEDLIVGDQWLADFIGELSDEESPYLFNVIEVEILGNVYERFLGKTVRPHGRGVTIEEKPEVRKAGGVYYTPRYIVDYIVEQTVGRLLTPILEVRTFAAFEKQTAALRLLDPACGSGSFLIRTFERVCEHWQRRLTRVPAERRPELCWVDPATGDVHLSIDLKRRILRDNIYGVDIDAQAVEVTQLSLYLKMLENENRITLQRQRELFAKDTALLPSLEHNIKCGNSLIGSNFSLDPDDLVRVNAFDWPVQFKNIMKGGGFDAIVGNPPWGAEIAPQERKYLSERFSRVVGRMIDTYIYFGDQALRLTRQEGSVGLVIPATVLNQVDTAPLRELFLQAGLRAVINAGKDIFTKKVLNTTALIVTAGDKQPAQMYVGDLSHIPLDNREDALSNVRQISSNDWIDQVKADSAHTFFASFDARSSLLFRLRKVHPPLGQFTLKGIARGVSPDIAAAHIVSDNSPKLKSLESVVLRRSISGKAIKRYCGTVADQWLLYTHKGLLPHSIPNTIAHLGEYRTSNSCKEVKEGKHPWWALHRSRDPDIFRSPKFIGLTTTKTIEIVLDENQNLVVTDAMYVFRFDAKVACKAALGILHSKLFLFLYRVSNQGEARIIPQIKAAKLEPLPFPDLASMNKLTSARLEHLVDKMLGLMPKLRSATTDREKAAFQNAVTATDHQIDELVYELYGLTPEEIALVEGTAEG